MADGRRKIYTDGACSGNPGPGGWAWIAKDGPFGAGPSPDTTNQRMELQAVLEAVETNEGPLEIISDSTYVVNCFKDRWWEGWLKRGWTNSQKKPVANRDLWEPLIAGVRPRDIEFTWVKGHAGDEWNDLADRLAVEACATQQLRAGDARPTEIGEPDKRPKLGTVGRDPTGREAPEGHRLVVRVTTTRARWLRLHRGSRCSASSTPRNSCGQGPDVPRSRRDVRRQARCRDVGCRGRR